MKLKWLPIESAPKDGTKIILWSSAGIYTGSFLSEFPLDNYCFDGLSYDLERFTINHQPIFWIPIPEFEEEESEFCEWYRETGRIKNTTSCGNEIYMEFFYFIKNPVRNQKIFKYCPMCSKEIKWASSSSN